MDEVTKRNLRTFFARESMILKNHLEVLRDKLVAAEYHANSIRPYEVPGDGFQTGYSFSFWKDDSRQLGVSLKVDVQAPNQVRAEGKFKIALHTEWSDGFPGDVHFNGSGEYFPDILEARKDWLKKSDGIMVTKVFKELIALMNAGKNAEFAD